MEAALYAPEHGYYTGSPRRVGRGGDFYTAVSVGPLYGRLLAEHAAARWNERGRPACFVLAEQGAHDGQLMRDVLEQVAEGQPELTAALEVVIIEPKAAYRTAQNEQLRALRQGGLRWVESVTELPAGDGLFFCNELLDAFPVHRVRLENGEWRELGVALNAQQLTWQSRELNTETLRRDTERLPKDLPDGFVTEIQTAAADWVRELASSPFAGEVWLADYFLDAAAYWSAERPLGTLRRYFQHRMGDRVLESLGEADLTCHVNSTTLLDAAQAGGWALLEDCDQGAILTRLATPWLRSLEGSAPDEPTRALLRQFQTLTHPGLMGRSFHVLRLARQNDAP